MGHFQRDLPVGMQVDRQKDGRHPAHRNCVGYTVMVDLIAWMNRVQSIQPTV
jgi:hypothetical protein